MATYYVRPDGNNANTGLGPATNQAWQTITKALGATGIASGDTVYIAPGSYNESVTIGMTSATATTSVIGDPTASQFTGVAAGPVLWTVYTALGASPTLTSITATSKDFLSFQNIYFDGGKVAFTTSNNLSFINCQFIGCSDFAANSSTVNLSSPTSNALNATFLKCTFSGADFGMTLTGQNVSDTTSITNCLFLGSRIGASTINLQCSIYNCTFFGIRPTVALGFTGGSASFLSTVTNNLFFNCTQAIYSDTPNRVTQTYNRFISCSSTVSNVSNSATSTTTFSSGLIFPYQLQNSLGTFQMFSSILGGPNTSYGTATGAPATDMYGVAWTGTSPDAGSATYRNLSSVSQYVPTERNASTITIAPGETSRSLYLYLGVTGLTHTTTNLTASYTRNGQASVPITLVAQTPTGSYVSGGFCEVSAPYARGTYRLDVPNAAFDFGADDVTIFVGGANTTNGAVVTCNMQGIAGNIVHIGPFKVIGDGLGSDQPLDIVQGVQAPVSVQLVDANENGVDISGATVEAKVYNAIGSLIATYSCVPVYAADGRCTFQLTISVTNTAGVYNVTLTRTIGGNIVVFGPMKMIVRAN